MFSNFLALLYRYFQNLFLNKDYVTFKINGSNCKFIIKSYFILSDDIIEEIKRFIKGICVNNNFSLHSQNMFCINFGIYFCENFDLSNRTNISCKYVSNYNTGKEVFVVSITDSE